MGHACDDSPLFCVVFGAYQVRDRVAVARSLEQQHITVEEHRRRQHETNVLYTQSFETQAAAYRKSLEELEAKYQRDAEAVLSAATTHKRNLQKQVAANACKSGVL